MLVVESGLCPWYFDGCTEWHCGDRHQTIPIVFWGGSFVGWECLILSRTGEECLLRDGQNATQKPFNQLNWVPRMQCGIPTSYVCHLLKISIVSKFA